MVNYTCEVPQAYLLSPTGDYGCFASFVTDFLVLNSPLDSTHSKCQYSTGGFQLCPTKRRKVKLHAHVWQKCFVSQKPDIEFSREVGYVVRACHMLDKVADLIATARPCVKLYAVSECNDAGIASVPSSRLGNRFQRTKRTPR